jgi:multimeric flavodoxin WrbA
VHVAIVYHSATGTTRQLAEAVQRGAEKAGASASLHAVVGSDIHEGRFRNEAFLAQLDGADAIVFGCPTFMGGPSAPMKAFLDATLSRWSTRAWAGKLGAGFSVSSTPSGDKLATLVGLLMTAMQLGMLWVGLDQLPLNQEGLNRLSFYLGVGAQPDYTTNPPGVQTPDLRTGELLGARVARLARQLRAGAAVGDVR